MISKISGGTRSRGKAVIFKHPNVHREFVEYSETQKLHIVSVYSNPYRWQRRRENFHDFRFHMEASPNIALHVVEVAFGDRPHEVTSPDNPLDLQLRTDTSLWIKECAINEGVRRFPPDWQYGGYVDGDFHFTRHDWALEAIHMLQHHSFVQLFSTYTDLTGETATSHLGHRPYRMSMSFAWNYLHQTDFLSSRRARRGGTDTYYAKLRPSKAFPFGHPPRATGGAWAWRRDAFEMVGGMLDTCVLGSADWHMAFGLVQATNVAAEMKRCTGPYVEAVLNWQARAAKLNRIRRPITDGVHRQLRHPCFSRQQIAARVWRAVGASAKVGLQSLNRHRARLPRIVALDRKQTRAPGERGSNFYQPVGGGAVPFRGTADGLTF